MKKASKYRYLDAFGLSLGRCERIRTFDPLHPMQVRYQAAPHTDLAGDYSRQSDSTLMRHREQVANFKQLTPHEQKAV